MDTNNNIQLLDIINKVLMKHNREELSELNAEYSLRKDLKFDSFDLAELTVRIEDKFGIDIFENGLIDKISDIIEKLSKSDVK